MGKPQTYQLEYLSRDDGVFFVGLKGPRGGLWSFPLTAATMTRLMTAYLRSGGALAGLEREEPGASMRRGRDGVSKRLPEAGAAER